MKAMDLADERMGKKGRNQTALVGECILNLILVGAYLTEVTKGSRTLVSFLVILVLCLLPVIMAIATYVKSNDSVAIRYIIAIGFCLLYTYIMFTTTTNIAFCFITVLFMLLTVYADTKLSIGVSIAGIAINAAVIGRNVMTTGLTPVQVAEAKIIILSLVIGGLFSLMAVNKMARINGAITEKINREKEQSDALLQLILRVADEMNTDIETAVDETQRLKDSITITKSSMEELTGGANEAVSAIQMQQMNTDEISRHVDKVEIVTDTIMGDVNAAEECLKDGQETMDNLIQQVKVSEEASNLVARYMNELREYADRMQGIMTLISNVASQTGLLALNASIEAARAGEAGRGFAVVASEISNLAGQTSNATGDINSLISNISKSLTEVADSVDGLLNSNKMQNTYVSSTAQNFDMIRSSTKAIFTEAANLKAEVEAVAQSNDLIISSIENVSAVTEEVTADAGETLDGSKRNLESIAMVAQIMESLKNNAEELKKSRDN